MPAHLAMSPRAQREAVALRQAGCDVTVSGVWLNSRLARIDKELAQRLKIVFRPAADLVANVGQRLVERAGGRWARWRFEHGRRFSPALLGYAMKAQLRLARRIDADLTIAHGEAGLWIASELQSAGRRVGIDFEDWFSRDLPKADWRRRPVDKIAEMESVLLHEAAYRTASSGVMADALGTAFDVAPPAVVTNAVPSSFCEKKREPGPLRLLWLSQTIGPSRGLELLFHALPLVRSRVQLTLLGALRGGHRDWLHGMIPVGMRERVTIEPPVAPWDLPDRVAAHDVGLVLETRGIVSRDLCLPNKLFHYVAGGLAIIATRTRAMDEALGLASTAGRQVSEYDPHELAAAIDSFAACPARLASAQAASRHAGETVWNSEQDRNVILSEAERALGPITQRVTPASDRSIAAAAL